MDEREELRNKLSKFKMKRYSDITEDFSNIFEILDEYKALAKAAKKLIPLHADFLQDAIQNHARDFLFFATAEKYLGNIHEQLESNLRYNRGMEYNRIRNSREQSDLNDRGINQLIDGNPEIQTLTTLTLDIKDVHEEFVAIIDAYEQRSYRLNNLVKVVELEAGGIVL